MDYDPYKSADSFYAIFLMAVFETAPTITFFPSLLNIRQIRAIVFVFPQPGGPLMKVTG